MKAVTFKLLISTARTALFPSLFARYHATRLQSSFVKSRLKESLFSADHVNSPRSVLRGFVPGTLWLP